MTSPVRFAAGAVRRCAAASASPVGGQNLDVPARERPIAVDAPERPAGLLLGRTRTCAVRHCRSAPCVAQVARSVVRAADSSSCPPFVPSIDMLDASLSYLLFA